ncbi:Aste57867_18822 [Aphanomyces stellatus]|uniref:Aste57867_18822 protein n=1 Tax=Aphanomyces stellatus TaxID=120398 RepID=A0A485LBA6_9STRA|nr:hypothetical protein As57867_018758 [Aphanomyces stellatus]VFT95556.1 Aste57867_18822 [Aphanomyces stellatus]
MHLVCAFVAVAQGTALALVVTLVVALSSVPSTFPSDNQPHQSVPHIKVVASDRALAQSKRIISRKRLATLTVHPSLRRQNNSKLVLDLQRWVHEVLYHLHPRVNVIPASVMRSLAIPHPPLHRLVYHITKATPQQPVIRSSFDTRRLCAQVQRAPLAYGRLHRWLTRCAAQRHPHGQSQRRLLVIAKQHVDNAVRLIQGLVRSRLAIMLLACKKKYFEGLVHSPHVHCLGRVRRAAILIQAAWRFRLSVWRWRPYVRIYRVRLLVLASRLRHSRRTLAMTPHVKQVYPVLLAQWFGLAAPSNPPTRVWFTRRPSVLAAA